MSPIGPRIDGALRDLARRFDLRVDQAPAEDIDAAIRAGVSFRGTNLWVLIFAIFIASIGLNVNSAAVIIGAMLISPLMGPIIAVGYGAAVNDGPLIRSAMKNLGIAVLLSLLTSSFYFVLTPLSAARSELLARTSPAIWDVLIAFFGGLAGMIGSTRREKGNVVPGVAIATALMPPLCTAGYGLATLQPSFFLGAFYLFTINSVFIGTAALLMSRVMKLPLRANLDEEAARNSRRAIVGAVLLAGLPSVYLAVRLVQDEFFLQRAERFVRDSFPEDRGTYVVARDLDPRTDSIRLTVVGEPLSDDTRAALAQSMLGYGLEGASLRIVQNRQESLDLASLRQSLATDLTSNSLLALEQKSAKIESLEQQIAAHNVEDERLSEIGQELRATRPDTLELSVADGVRWGVEGGEVSNALIVSLVLGAPMAEDERKRLEDWLRVRAKREDVFLRISAPEPEPPPKRR